jgi:DNA-directed RNA polymerase subunit RPC12/RpoP
MKVECQKCGKEIWFNYIRIMFDYEKMYVVCAKCYRKIYHD